MPEWLDDDVAFDLALKSLWDFLRVGDAPQPSDAIFLFGGPYADAAQTAADLFLAGLASLIVVTGNRGTGSGHFEGNSEADYFGRLLLNRGIDQAAILLEERATNTGENVDFGMKVLKQRLPEPRRLLLIASPGHLRRCVATFQKQFPVIEVLGCPPDGLPSYFARQYSRRRVAERLVEEIDRLQSYPVHGYIVVTNIPSGILAATDDLRRRLASQ